MSDDADILAATVEFHRRQREAITTQRDELVNQRDAINEKIAVFDNLLVRFDRFDAPTAPAMSSRPPPQRTRGAAPASRSNGGQRPARGRGPDALRVITDGGPDGLTRGEILARVGVKGDKSGENSVSNALTAMTKAGKINRLDGGKYVVAAGAA